VPIIKLSTGPVHFIEAGSGNPLVLLHANPGDSRDFEEIIPALSKTYRVIALDWPGYGSSPLNTHPCSVDVMFYYHLLYEFLDCMALSRAVFIGNSLGGNVAARLASRRPERVAGLVLVSPGGFTTPSWITRGFCKLQGSAWSLSPYRFASFYLKKRSKAVQAMLERARGEQSLPAMLALNRSIWRSFARPENDLRESAKEIVARTLLVFGDRDPVISAHTDGSNAARAIGTSRTVTMPCGHAPFAELPEQFLDEVLPFIAECGQV